MDDRFSGKVTLVLGAGSVGPGWGNGRATAHAVLFLASDQARYITATELVVDGGLSATCVAPHPDAG